MTLVSVHAMLGPLAAIALASAPVPTTGDHDDVVGIVWHDQATVPAEIRQRVRQAVVDAVGEAGSVVDDVDVRARVAMATELDELHASAIVELTQRLDAAIVSYREGDLRAAAGEAWAVLESLERDPVLPGAASLAFRAHVLSAQVAWTSRDAAEAKAALRRAYVLDPERGLTTRQVAPAVAELFAEVQAELGSRDGWRSLVLAGDADGALVVEIDDREGLRLVPPGRHFVVVRRPGRRPVAAVHDTSEPFVVPAEPLEVPRGLPLDARHAQRLCALGRVGRLVLTRADGTRVALELYRCGDRFAGIWYSGHDGTGLKVGARRVLAEDGTPRDIAVLAGGRPWPDGPSRDVLLPVEAADRPSAGPVARPWYRRAWIWSIVGVAVVGAAVTGAVLGTRPDPPQVRVDTDSFLQP